MNKLGCSGDEYRLVDCNYEPSTWEHNEDWSVVCINGTLVTFQCYSIYSIIHSTDTFNIILAVRKYLEVCQDKSSL